MLISMLCASVIKSYPPELTIYPVNKWSIADGLAAKNGKPVSLISVRVAAIKMERKGKGREKVGHKTTKDDL